MDYLLEINNFLLCKTPTEWVEQAILQPELLLIDHAHCEKKAASIALKMLFRYVDYPNLLHKLSRLAREELRHFERVLAIMQARGIAYQHLAPSAYAKGLHAQVRSHEPARLFDLLLIGAIIEARSCERFASLLPHLDLELARFYQSLLKSEARHYQDYLTLARECVPSLSPEARLAPLLACEAELIQAADPLFRFHSGIPQLA